MGWWSDPCWKNEDRRLVNCRESRVERYKKDSERTEAASENHSSTPPYSARAKYGRSSVAAAMRRPCLIDGCRQGPPLASHGRRHDQSLALFVFFGVFPNWIICFIPFIVLSTNLLICPLNKYPIDIISSYCIGCYTIFPIKWFFDLPSKLQFWGAFLQRFGVHFFSVSSTFLTMIIILSLQIYY
jgi:hypothetical protein